LREFGRINGSEGIRGTFQHGGHRGHGGQDGEE
jgi:hypothetical protein